MGYTNEDGYGRIGTLRAHRVAWSLKNGPIPDGMLVCHSCDSPPCCNDAHHFLGTQADNAADMARKRRSNIGAKNPQAKLTAEQVAEIRAAPGSQRKIAARFGVGQTQVGKIKRGERWRNHQPDMQAGAP
jgi:hypothetical protein